MDLRHLRYFMAVAEELHFGRAAERLHIAQPPLSQQIRQLEAELGFQLFYRTKRSVELTEAGQVFLQECQRLFRQLDQAIEMGRQVSRGELGQLVIGFVSSAAYNVLPTLLRSFRMQIPKVSLELHELTTDQQLHWLHDRRLDVGLIRPPVDDPTFAAFTILQESLVVALPEQHPLACQHHVSLQQLAHEAFVLFPRPLAPGLYDQIISLCQQVGFSPNVVQEAIQMQTIVSLVAAEIGVAIVPISLQNLQRTGVIYKPLQEPTPKAEIAIAWRRSDVSPIVERFLEIARQLIL
ncbi:LysR family transcriptional regulator [Thermocoleostomius sinensis]|uniref:LysR family transcriptional regulator n=1 Tax=Thermocoleostomius sinensis TaxID=3065396 RepID=UPI0028F45D5B|nr:LysR family transcriptional regulator [Thermocoleostomius sinensis]